ncbi:hypothetical protein EV2_043858 [Malus domestica]
MKTSPHSTVNLQNPHRDTDTELSLSLSSYGRQTKDAIKTLSILNRSSQVTKPKHHSSTYSSQESRSSQVAKPKHHSSTYSSLSLSSSSSSVTSELRHINSHSDTYGLLHCCSAVHILHQQQEGFESLCFLLRNADFQSEMQEKIQENLLRHSSAVTRATTAIFLKNSIPNPPNRRSKPTAY